ncbi:MAG: sigma-54-dependent Fis family transcriptional regulator [Planctomycetia bacterium]|nr:MAG: sigma-54-dependent Fis family transcriptional regulator [Planctomycetia bacterium]
MATVCVIEDQPMMRDSLTATLKSQDHEVVAFDNGPDALTAMRQRQFDVVLTDLRLPGMDGVALLREARRLGLDVPTILMTAHASVDTAVEAMKLGAFDYVQKPFKADAIEIIIERAIRSHRMARDNEVLRRTIEDIAPERRLVGEAPAMRPVLEKIQRVAQSSATVLITGESGVGKELIARAIHAASPRATQPMLCVNCAALSPTLLESELFGHEKGAFTGADRTRKGRFELADGGTLLLDEVSEIPPPLQAKLLRVLQEREFERVGSSITRRVDVRVIATTNRDLRDWAAKARFREDLYYRLSVLPVEVPPLRDRREDIPQLMEHMISRITRREGREAPSFTTEALQLLAEYAWPGNVRELQNLCERVCVLEAGRSVTPQAISPLLAGPVKQAAASVQTIPYQDGRILEDAERELILRTLARFNGHRERSARALGIGLRTLGLKLKKWREDGTFVEPPRRTPTLVGALA